MAHGSGGGEGKATFHDLSFVHNIDKASPVLMQSCANGAHLKEATITHRKAGKGQQEFLIVKMNDVIITGVTHGGSSDGRPYREREPGLRQSGRRVQAAEGRRVARRGHPLQVRLEGQEGSLAAENDRGRPDTRFRHGARPWRRDMFLSVNGAKSGQIAGEAQDQKHKNEIEVLGWSWGMPAQERARRRRGDRQGDDSRTAHHEEARQGLDRLDVGAAQQ